MFIVFILTEFDVLTVVRSLIIFWFVTPRNPVDGYHCFGVMYRIHLQDANGSLFWSNVGNYLQTAYVLLATNSRLIKLIVMNS